MGMKLERKIDLIYASNLWAIYTKQKLWLGILSILWGFLFGCAYSACSWYFYTWQCFPGSSPENFLLWYRFSSGLVSKHDDLSSSFSKHTRWITKQGFVLGEKLWVLQAFWQRFPFMDCSTQ